MPAEEEESGFTVRDRRRFVADDAPAPAAAPATPPAAPPPVPAAAVPAPPVFTDAEREAYDAAEEAALLEEEMAAMEAAGLGGGQMPGGVPSVYQVMAVFLNEMRTLALVRLGLIAPPDATESLRDLGEAKAAIDTAAFLAGQLEAVVAPEERLPLRAMVSELQLTYVEASRAGGAGGQ